MTKLYTLDEAQKIWTKIIKKRAQELKKDLSKNNKSDNFKILKQKIAYV